MSTALSRSAVHRTPELTSLREGAVALCWDPVYQATTALLGMIQAYVYGLDRFIRTRYSRKQTVKRKFRAGSAEVGQGW